MRFKDITIENIGPYVGTNVFSFNIQDKHKNIILIGGNNGSGKTTFFNAIKTCLYGSIAYGFETPNNKYFDKILFSVNTNEKLKKEGHAKIRICLLFDDGINDTEYTFLREWNIINNKVREIFYISKNDVILTENERDDFQSYFLQVLPPSLLQFYFFNGEEISDFVFSNNSNFKNAFLKLCNLDTINIISDNFHRITKIKLVDDKSVAESYEKICDAGKVIESQLIQIGNDKSDIKTKIADIDSQMVSIEKAYSKSGGISKQEWQSMINQIAKEELRREELRKWLRDCANNIIPFIILRREMEELKGAIEKEHQIQVSENIKAAINSNEIKNIIKNILHDVGVEFIDDITDKIAFEITNYNNSGGKTVLNLSELNRFELIAKINNLNSFDISRIDKATKEIDCSLKRVKKIRQKIERSSTENYDDYLLNKIKLNEKKGNLLNKLRELDHDEQVIRDEKNKNDARLLKARSEYEQLLRKQSVADISARALLAFNEIQETLYHEYISAIEDDFHRSFSNLINKFDLIDGIHISDELDVIPYKNKTMIVDDVKKLIKRDGREHLISRIGLSAFKVLQEEIKSGKKEITLPIEVKRQFSAGEKQIFIMALYQALSKLNQVNVPYMIDTPFARIDKNHRQNILECFFKQLNGQVIILSTDEEIIGDYKKGLDNEISNTFLIRHSMNGYTDVIENTYFGENQ